MSEILKKIEGYDLIKSKKVNIEKISSLKFSKLLDFADDISSYLSQTPPQNCNNLFEHTASLALGGGRDECNSFKCRQNRLLSLSRYAALYCDKVYIDNFLSDYAPSFGHPPKNDSQYFRRRVAEDIALLISIRPLISNNIVIPYNISKHYCVGCMSEIVFGKDSKRILKKVARSLSDEVRNEVNFGCFKKMGLRYYAFLR